MVPDDLVSLAAVPVRLLRLLEAPRAVAGLFVLVEEVRWAEVPDLVSLLAAPETLELRPVVLVVAVPRVLVAVLLSLLTVRLVEVPRLLLLSVETLPVRLVEVPRLLPLSVEALPVRLVEVPRLLPLSVETLPVRLVEVPRVLSEEVVALRPVAEVPRPVVLPETSPVRDGAGLTERLPVARSVTVMVLSERLLVIRLPLRWVGSFWMVALERDAVILPTSGSLV